MYSFADLVHASAVREIVRQGKILCVSSKKIVFNTIQKDKDILMLERFLLHSSKNPVNV